MLSNWARDRGYGMGERAGYISGAVGGQHVALAHTGFMFDGDAEGMRRWRGWWRIVSADQWGVFFTGAILGMILPGDDLRHVPAARHRHPGARHQRGAGAGHHRHGRRAALAAPSRSSAPGFCSRPSSISSKA